MSTAKITLIMCSLVWSDCSMCTTLENVRGRRWNEDSGRGRRRNTRWISWSRSPRGFSLKQTDLWTSAMAPRILLLLLLFCIGERNCMAVDLSEDVQVTKNKSQQASAHPRSTYSVRNKTLENRLQIEMDDIRTLPNVSFKMNDGEPNDFDLENNSARKTVTLKHPGSDAKSLMPQHRPELTVNHEERSNLTNGEVEGVINDHGLVPSSEEEHSLQPGLRLETGVGKDLPEKTRGRPRWLPEPEDGGSGPRSRQRRSWLWNQFFVIEEYRGPEPVLIGRVSWCRHLSACTCESPVSVL